MTPNDRTANLVGIFVGAAVLGAFALGIWFVFLRDTAPSDSSLDSRARVQAQNSVKSLLRDSDSAEFRNLQVLHSKSGGRYVCGEVNSRNAFGGYVGYQQFVSVGQMTFLQEQASDFSEVWKEFCR